MKNEELFNDILNLHFTYLIIETKWTIHHIERTLYKDRGKIKWIAETKPDAYACMSTDEEARRSDIDGGDLFPRLYFLPASFIIEFGEWLNARLLKITSIKHGAL